MSTHDGSSAAEPGNTSAQAMLGALSRAKERLDYFGYELYLERRAPARRPCRSVTLGAEGFTIHRPGNAERFDGVVMFSAGICQDRERRRVLDFVVLFTWRRDEWCVRTSAETDSDEIDGTVTLWESTPGSVASVPEAVRMLERAIVELQACVHTERVAAWLCGITRTAPDGLPEPR